MGERSGMKQNSGNKGEIRSIEGYTWVNRGMGTWKKGKDGVSNVTCMQLSNFQLALTFYNISLLNYFLEA